MIGYTMVGTRDLERSRRFYAPLFTEMGLDPCWRDDQVSSWGKADDTTVPRFFTGYPFDGHPATVGNGTMTAFLIDSAGRIDRLHRIAMEHGGTDEGGARVPASVQRDLLCRICPRPGWQQTCLRLLRWESGRLAAVCRLNACGRIARRFACQPIGD
jgi:catechol 2,3-dioxygenase-like lactoylglutathione lyase family enzyme